MAAKLVRVSTDSGVTYYAVPGPGADLSIESAALNDTILGQTFTSEFPGLQSWSINTNGYYKGIAGYVATIKKAGSSTAVTGEAFTLVSGKTYQINSVTKRVWNRAVTPVIKDNAVAVSAANILSYDYLFGKVTFVSTYTVTGPVTADISYLPLAAFSKGQSFTLTQQATALDVTTYATAQANSGYMSNVPGLRTVSLDIDGIYDLAEDNIADLQSRGEYIIELCADGSGLSLCRGFFHLMSVKESGDVGANEVEALSFNLSVPSADYIPFGWQHSNSTTLPTAIKLSLDAWSNETTLSVQYLPGGVVASTGGQAGTGVVTDITLTSAVDGLNEFTLNFQGSGALADV